MLHPCGLNALWIGYDEFSLSHISDEIALEANKNVTKKGFLTQAPLVPTDQGGITLTNGLMHATILRRKRQRLKAPKARLTPVSSSQEEISDESGSTTSVVLSLGTLKDMLGLSSNLLEEIKDDVQNLTTSEMLSRNETQAREFKNLTEENSTKIPDCLLLDRLRSRWSGDGLKVLARKIQRNEADDQEVKLLWRLLGAMKRRSDGGPEETGDIEYGENDINKLKDKLEPLFQTCMEKETQPHSHKSINANLSKAQKTNVLRPIEIKSSTNELLDSYQQKETYPRETAVIMKHQQDGGKMTW